MNDSFRGVFAPDTASPESLLQPRATLDMHIRIVENGAIVWLSGSHPSFPATMPKPEFVATSVDQAMEKIREMLTKIWPR